MECFVGVDVGTSGVKAAILTDEGTIAGSGYVRNRMPSSSDGVAEQDPESWWQNTCLALRHALLASHPLQIRGVAVGGAGGVVPVDAKGAPAGSAIMQADRRCGVQLSRLKQALGPQACQIAGNRPADGISAAHVYRWILEGKPGTTQKTDCFLSPNGYINFRLTGRRSASVSRSGASLLLDLKERQWSDTLAEACGVPMEKLPPVYEDREIIGTITARAARETGLPEGIPVAAGSMDTAAAGLGCGLLESGGAYVVLGTFGKFCVLTEGKTVDPAFVNVPYAKPELLLTFCPTDGGAGLTVDWLCRLTGMDHEAMNAAARSVTPGCGGLLFFPWMAGGRGEQELPRARAAFTGLDRCHGPGHLYRAVMEGVAYSARTCMLRMEQALSVQLPQITLCGGGSRSKVWAKILADVLNKPVQITAQADTEAAGAAMLAQYAVTGHWRCPEYLRASARIWPDPACAAGYMEGYRRFQAAAKALGSIYPEERRIK